MNISFTHFLGLFVALIFATTASATHNRGGTIEYRYLGNLNYEVKIITYTKISSPSDQADRSALSINWGDGSALEVLSRTSYQLVAPDVQQNIYTGTHRYTNTGTFILSMTDPNRNDGVININNGNSIGVQFHIEAVLRVDNTHRTNNSFRYLPPSIVEGEQGQPFTYSLTGYDPDGDVVLYDMDVPMQSIGQDVPNYVLPSGVSVDPLTGLFTWLNPQNVGQYTFTVRAREFRDNQLVGITYVDFEVHILPPASNYRWQGTQNWASDSATAHQHYFTVAPNTPIQLGIVYQDSNTTAGIEAYSSTLAIGTATQATMQLNPSADSLAYNWTPTAADARCQPYVVTFRGNSEFTGRLFRDLNAVIYVRDQTTTNCDSVLNGLILNTVQRLPDAQTLSLSVHPNPFHTSCQFELDPALEAPEVQLTITDINGRVVAQERFNGHQYTFDSAVLSTGVYFYTLTTTDGKQATGKLVKQ